jgi:uncharacterized membrane protein YccC
MRVGSPAIWMAGARPPRSGSAMTDMPEPPAPTGSSVWKRAVGWISTKDPGYLAIKKSARAAIVMPSVFALAHWLFSNPQVGLFGAFGSFSLLLLADFPGPPRTRVVSYVALWLVGSGFIALGTAVSTHKVAAVVTMGLVGFAVLFCGIVSPQVAVASTAALLLFVLPVAFAGPASAIGSRLGGWALAGVLCIPASMLLWRTHWHDKLRRRLSATVAAAGRLAAARAEGRFDPAAKSAVTAELTMLRDQFASTPYPPTGAAAGAVALTKLVGRVEWVATNEMLASDGQSSLETPQVREVIGAVAENLRLSALLIGDGDGHPSHDQSLIESVKESTRHLDQLRMSEVYSDVSALIRSEVDVPFAVSGDQVNKAPDSDDGTGIATSLFPSFHARGLAVATEMVARGAVEATGGDPLTVRGMGTPDDTAPGAVRQRLASHLSFRSVWFRNAVRGAAGLALAVGVVEATAVEHGFWVVLGTLSVLRSNALGTGSTALRAVGGTAVGVVVGSAIMLGVGAHAALLWALLPIAILVSGVAPSMISFAAGQAGFTLVVIILFNIIGPAGWKVGLTRFEDVAIGCAVSVVAGLLFWPRGATAALGRAMSDAFVASSGYLADSVDHLTTTAYLVDTKPGERAAHLAYLRLDDAFRQFLAERGAKVVPVETIAELFTGANRIRLAAYTLANMPEVPTEPGQPELESVLVAGAVLRDSYATSHRWYVEFAELLANRRDSLEPPPDYDETLHHALRDAFEDARAQRRADRLRTTLRMLWADDLLESQRKVQVDLGNSADLFVRRRRQRRLI